MATEQKTPKEQKKSWEDYKRLFTQLMRRVKDLMRTCSACHKPGARFKCADCLLVYYHSKECQMRHWYTGGHAEKCPSYQKEKDQIPAPQIRRRTLVYQIPIRSTDGATTVGAVEIARIHHFISFIGCFISPFIIFVQTTDNRYVCIPYTRKRDKTDKYKNHNIWYDTNGFTISLLLENTMDRVYLKWLSMFTRLRPPIANEITKERLLSDNDCLRYFLRTPPGIVLTENAHRTGVVVVASDKKEEEEINN